MFRTPRILTPGDIYHIVCRGNDRAPLFHDVDDFAYYLERLKKLKETFAFGVHHYVLMPNHVHFVVCIDDDRFSAYMQYLQTSYTKYYGSKYGNTGHTQEGRFRSFEIRDDAYLFACGNYVQMNPVRAWIVDDPRHWKWSSYRFYAFRERDSLVEPSPLL